LVLNILDIITVVLEEDGVLGVKSILQVVSVEDRLEFSQELEGVRDAGDNIKVLVNVDLELSLDGRNTNVELNEISIEEIVAVVQESVVLSLELLDAFVELTHDWLNIFKVVLLKGLELLDGSEKINELGDSSAEEVELTEDLVW
jgi:hypothetical protein